MCERIAGLHAGLRAAAERLDVTGLTPGQARELVGELAGIERIAAALSARLAARAAQGGGWRAGGAASPAHELARLTGSSINAAAARLAAGKAMAGAPELAAAASAGRVSLPQLCAISGAGVDPTGTAELVALAEHASLGELEDECRRRRATGVDPEARRAAIHARRSLRHYTDSEGVAHLHLADNPERVALVIAALAPARERLYQTARTGGLRVPPDALDADALIATLTQPATGRTRAGRVKILIRVDFAALLRGYAARGETCEIAGYGPVAPSAITDLIATGNPVLVALATRGQKVTGVVNLRRRPTSGQTSALEWLQPGCAAQGCHRHAGLQTDHQQDWAATHITLLEWLDRLCAFHHQQKTRLDYALLPGTGKRPFVPPTDPRHPKNSHPHLRPRAG